MRRWRYDPNPEGAAMHDILLPSHRRTRLRNATRYPDEAAFLARIPLLGRRVPARAYWRRRPVHPEALSKQLLLSSPIFGSVAERVITQPDLPSAVDAARETAAIKAEEAAHRLRHLRDQLPDAIASMPLTQRANDLREAARHRGEGTDIDAPDVSGEDVKRVTQRSSRAVQRTAILGGVGLGALLMYYFDRASGRRRRALVRDQVVHLFHVVTRRVPDRIEQRGRFFRGVARGLRHEAAGVVLNGRESAVDDETLVDRVRSEVLGARGIKAGEIHLDAYEGAVTLRGQLQYPDEIRRLIEDTSRVEGVRRVRSYLHLPGTLAPNKAEIYELERGPYSSGGGSSW
jgi:hypothetical protein